MSNLTSILGEVVIKDRLPTEGSNPEVEYDYTDPSSIILTKTIGSDTYQQTITIIGTVATEGAWVKL